MEKTVYKYLIRYSLSQQVWLTALAVLSFPFLYAFYELPKRIINEAILGDPEDFPVDLFEFDFDQTGYLLLLCVGFLILVLINQAFKYYINVYQGLTGERMLRRLRYQLFSRVLRFPQPTFKNMSQGEIIPMITAEVEPLGGFIGEAFALPAFQGGTLIVILAFLFYQNWIMAGAAVALYPIQLYLIPRLQMRVNALGKERVRLVRRLSDRIGGGRAGCSGSSHSRYFSVCAGGFLGPVGPHFPGSISHLPPEVRHQIHQQLHPAARSVLLLFAGRLPGDLRRARNGDAGGRDCCPQGSWRTLEGVARFLPAARGLEDQVRPGGQPVRTHWHA